MTDLEFYETYKDQVSKFGILNVFEDREDRILFRNIAKQIEGIKTFKNPNRSWSGISMKKYSRPESWTDDEIEYLADLYLQHVNPTAQSDEREIILRKFRLKFDTHSDDAVEIAIRSFVTMDNLYPALGRSPNRTYYEILNSKCPGRFVYN
jgi:hypothetical protein